MKNLVLHLWSSARLVDMWVVWRLFAIRAVMLRTLDFIYAPGEPLPSVLRAEVAVAFYGERYATAKKQHDRASKLRERRIATSAELDIRSAAIQAAEQRRAA
jgi:hypothetical protein